MRVIRDDTGVDWTVFVVVPGTLVTRRTNTMLPDALSGGWLCFQSMSQTRRLAPVPEGWESLTEAELKELCVQAVAGRRR